MNQPVGNQICDFSDQAAGKRRRSFQALVNDLLRHNGRAESTKKTVQNMITRSFALKLS